LRCHALCKIKCASSSCDSHDAGYNSYLLVHSLFFFAPCSLLQCVAQSTWRAQPDHSVACSGRTMLATMCMRAEQSTTLSASELVTICKALNCLQFTSKLQTIESLVAWAACSLDSLSSMELARLSCLVADCNLSIRVFSSICSPRSLLTSLRSCAMQCTSNPVCRSACLCFPGHEQDSTRWRQSCAYHL
jgi:hypothetical protein